MSEPSWLRQPGLACEFCGRPGHLIAVPPPISVVYAAEPETKSLDLNTRVTCPEHRFLVEQRARNEQDPARFAERDHGRPVLGGVTYPDRTKRALRTLLRRLMADQMARSDPSHDPESPAEDPDRA